MAISTRGVPANRLDPRARDLWRITGALETAVVAAVVLGVAWLAVRAGLAPPPFFAVAGGLVIVLALMRVWAVPELRWRWWRYEIGEAEVDLQHGWWTTTRTLIPMARVQHVDTRRGPLQRRFGLASVVLYTAAGANEIPALDDEAAAAARDRIAALANLADDL